MSDERKEDDGVPRDGREVDETSAEGAADDLSRLADAILQFDPGRIRQHRMGAGPGTDAGHPPDGAADIDLSLTKEETVALIGAVTLVMLMPGVAGKEAPKPMIWGLAKLMTALTTAA